MKITNIETFYLRLPNVALDSFVVFRNETDSCRPPPLLTVRADVGDEARDELYNITTGSTSSDQWPAPLRMGLSIVVIERDVKAILCSWTPPSLRPRHILQYFALYRVK